MFERRRRIRRRRSELAWCIVLWHGRLQRHVRQSTRCRGHLARSRSPLWLRRSLPPTCELLRLPLLPHALQACGCIRDGDLRALGHIDVRFENLVQGRHNHLHSPTTQLTMSNGSREVYCYLGGRVSMSDLGRVEAFSMDRNM